MYKRIIQILIVLLISQSLSFVSYAAFSEDVLEVFVSPYGYENGDGSITAPFNSLEKARDYARLIKSSNKQVVICLRGGTYRISDTFKLDASDSGFEGKPLVIKAYNKENVKIVNSVNIDSNKFKKLTNIDVINKIPSEARSFVYEADISDILPLAEGYTVPSGAMNVEPSYYGFYNNWKFQSLARWPNIGYTQTGEVLDDGSATKKPKFVFNNERINNWQNATKALLMGYWGNYWACQPLPLDSIDLVNKAVVLGKTPSYTIGSDKRFYIFNLIEELDSPGEWYIDKDSKKLYYYPEDDINNSSLELATNKLSLIDIENASFISFENINMHYTRGIGMNIINSNNITVAGSEISHIGQIAIKANGVKNVNIKSCDIYDVGGIGVYLNGGTRITLDRGNNSIQNCKIYNFGRLYKTYAGAIDLYGVGNRISHNEIYNSSHLAIRFSGNDHDIEYNDIHDVVKETKDAGAIYCGRNWTMRGTNIKYNYLHDIRNNIDSVTTTNADVDAIYLDDMYSGVNIYGNVFKNVSRAAMIGGGRDNTFSNNIVIDSGRGVWYEDRAKIGGWAHYHVLPGGSVNNSLLEIINDPNYNRSLWLGRYPELAGLIEDIQKQNSDPTYDAGIPKGGEFSNNYFSGSNVINTDYAKIDSLVTTYGQVSNNFGNLVSDLGFVDYASGNYNLTNSSIVYKNLPNFQPIPFNDIGTYQDDYRNQTLNENNTFTVILVIKDKNKIVKDTVIYKTEIKSTDDGSLDIPMDISLNAQSDWKIHCYIWRDITSQTPVYAGQIVLPL